MDCVSRVNPLSALAVAPVSFFTQLNNKLLAGTFIDALVTLAEVPPGPGSVIGEETGGPVISDPDTAKTWSTRGDPVSGAGLPSWVFQKLTSLSVAPRPWSTTSSRRLVLKSKPLGTTTA